MDLKIKSAVVINVVIFMIVMSLLSSCDDPVTASDGTLTITLSGAGTVDGDTMVTVVYEEGADITTDMGVSLNYGTINSGEASLTLMVPTGSMTPSSTTWSGTGGETYDVYYYIDTTNSVEAVNSGSDYMGKNWPLTLTVDGDRTIATSFSEDYQLAP